MIRLALAAFVAVLNSARLASGAAPAFEEVRDWLVREREAARGFPDLVLCELLYSVEHHLNVTEADVRALSEEVREDPRHPRFGELLRKRQFLARGPKTERFRAWILDQSNWRINQDLDGQEHTPFVDLILRERWACMSGLGELAVFDPRVGFPEYRNVAELHTLIAHPVRDLLFGGLAILPEGEPTRDGYSGDDSAFRIAWRESGSAGGDWVVEGAWRSADRRGLVARITAMNAASVGGGQVRAAAEDWLFDPETGRWFASLVTKFQPDGSIDRIIRFENAARVSRDEFERITALPSPVKGDAVRGPIAFGSVHDFRATPGEMIRRSTSEELPPVNRWRLALDNPAMWKSAGWAAFGGLVLALLILYVRRRMTA